MEFIPRPASDYTDQEKIKCFNEFHQFALEAFDYLVANDRVIKDCDHHAYEMVMELLGREVWEVINEIL